MMLFVSFRGSALVSSPSSSRDDFIVDKGAGRGDSHDSWIHKEFTREFQTTFVQNARNVGNWVWVTRSVGRFENPRPLGTSG